MTCGLSYFGQCISLCQEGWVKVQFYNKKMIEFAPRSRGYKTFFMLNSANHGINPAHKNVKMPTILIYKPSYCNFSESRKKRISIISIFFLFNLPTLNIICFVLTS